MRIKGTSHYVLFVGLMAFLCINLSLLAQTRQVGRIDATNVVARVTISSDGKLYAWDKRGKVIAGWPKDFSAENRFFVFEPRLIDTDFDLQEEVVAVSKAKDGGDLKLHVFKGNGQEIQAWGWPLPQNDLTATPLLTDVNHDSVLDIVFATQSKHVFIYASNFQKIKQFDDFENVPSVFVADLDNNGLQDLYIVVADQIFKWDPTKPDKKETILLPTAGEKILQPIAVVDVNHDLYPDLVYATEANHIVAVDRNGGGLLNIQPPSSGKLASGVIAEDIDIDREPELLVLTETQDILAFKTNGTQVVRWKEPLLYRQPLPTGGVVANDLYEGLFSTATGWDLYTIYRNKLEGYSHIALGENIHDWDEKADFNFIEAVEITDTFAFPKLFTPNGDGVNDTTQIHYRLSDEALVSLELYDAHERFLSRLMEKSSRSAGEHQETVNGLNTKGTLTLKDDTPLDTGTYIIKIVAQSKEGFVTSSKVDVIVNGIKAEIESPKDDNRQDTLYPGVFGKITISGIATDPNFGENNLDADFKAYKLYYRPGVWNISPEEMVTVGRAASGWLPLVVPARHQCADNAQNEPNDTPFPNSNVSCRPVQHGELGVFDAGDPTKTPNGEYTILLKVLDSNGNTIGKVNYDTLVVSVHNALAGDILLDPNNLFDPRNPNNLIYRGPKIVVAPLTNNFISRENPNTTINYTLQNETSNVHIDIFPYNGGSLGAAVSVYSFNRQAPAVYQFNWNGANTLGRNVDGGHYKIRITANAIDGTGTDINESLEFDVARGFSSRDILAVTSFTATPDHINPFGFGADLAPEKATLAFSLTKDAKVSLQVFNAAPELGGVLQKTLLKDQLRKADNVLWDGSADNGLILQAGRDYLVRLTAVGIDLGNDERAIQDVVIRLEQFALDSGLTAKLNELKGDEKEDFFNDGTLYSMAGSPDFLWRAKATGYVEVPFNYQISAEGTETYEAPQLSEKTEPTYGCFNDNGSISGPPFNDAVLQTIRETQEVAVSREISVPSSFSVQNFDVRVRNVGARVFSERIPYDRSLYGNLSSSLSDSLSNTGQMHIAYKAGGTIKDLAANTSQNLPASPPLVTSNTVHFFHYATSFSSQCTKTGDLCPAVCVYSNGAVIVNDSYFDCGGDWLSGGCDPMFTSFSCPTELLGLDPNTGQTRPIATLTGSGGGMWLHQCNDITVTAHGTTTATRSWPLSGQSAPTTSSNTTLNSLSVQPSLNISFSASVGSGDTNATNIQITGYNLTLSDHINGYDSSNTSNGSTIVLPALAGWLNGGTLQAEVRDNYNSRIVTFASDRDDPYTIPVPYRKIWGWHRGFNKDQYHAYTPPINFFTEGYVPNVWGQDPGRNLYTFSDAVHLTGWQVDVRYPNISVDKPDGDNPLDTGDGALKIFKLDDPFLQVARPLGNRNSDIEDTFLLKLLPEAQPKRFVEIHGNASANYELFYYDALQSDPKWVRIPPRTHNAVADTDPNNPDDDILAHWDVTRLNGKNYTVVLKITNPTTGKVNQDKFNIGIGTLVDTSKLKPDAFARVDSTFKRASLLFPPNSLSQPELITINPIPKNEADFRLPNGVAPLGPIFDIKPDKIKIDPRYHVQLELVFSPDEIKNAFGVDASTLQIYNLAGDELLEGLVTLVQFDTHGDGDPTNDVYRFTANLEHFSQYFLARKRFGQFEIASPKSDQYLKGVVNIQGRVVTERGDLAAVTKLDISYGGTNIYSGASAQFDIPWDVSSLNGNFVLLFEAENAAGSKVRYELPVAIDNTASQSLLLINGQAVADGGSIIAGLDSVVEIKSTDTVAGVQKIEYAWDGDLLADYLQPFTIPFNNGAHVVSYRATDKNGNLEAIKKGTIQIEETASPTEVSQTALTLILSGTSYSKNTQTWVTGETAFAIQATGGFLNAIKYRAGSATYHEYSSPFNLAGQDDGLYNIDYYSVDSSGLRGDIFSKQAILDTTPPVTTVSAVGDYQKFGNLFIVTPETQIILQAKDDGVQPVGVSRIEYRFGTEPWAVYRDPLRTSNLEPKTLSYRAVDYLGNTELEKVAELKLDDIPPTLQILGIPNAISPNGDGRKDTIEFSVLAADNFSKNLFITFTLTGRDGTRHVIWDRRVLDANKLIWDGKVSDTLLPEDVYSYEIYIADAQGNASETKTGTLVYDITAPQVTLLGGQVLSFSPNGDALSDILQVGYSVSDNLASQDIKTELHVESPEGFSIKEAQSLIDIPPNEHQFQWDGTNFAENPAFDGTYRYSVVAEDPAGNRSVLKSGEAQSSEGQIFIDRLPPQTKVTISNPQYKDKDKTWFAAASRIRLESVDPTPGSGVALIQYAFGDAAFVPFTDPFTVPMENIDYTLRYQSLDAVGNKEKEQSLVLRLDKTAPTTKISVGEPKIGEGEATWISPVTPITLQSQDPDGVGVKDIFVATPEVQETLVYDKPFSLVGLGDGLKHIYYWAEDKVANVETRNVLNINLDGTPPVTKIIIGEPSVSDTDFIYVTSATPFDFATTTERNDLDKTQYKINEEDWKIAGPFQISNEGNFSIDYRAIDTLGNMEPTHTQKVVVDNTPPDPKLNLNQGDGNKYVTRQTLISLDGVATGVGIKEIEYKIDDGPWQLYKGPFGIAQLGAGSHMITYRIRDRLGNLSAEKKFVAQMIDVLVEREDYTIPRTLVYLLQTFDLKSDDPRPNADLLSETLKEMGGYYKITDNLDEFVSLMRSGKYTTYVFATDSLVVNFSEEKKIIRMLKELKSRVDMGDAFINLTGFSKVSGKSWEMFKSNWSSGDESALASLDIAPELKSSATGHRYGEGHVVEFTTNVGSLAGKEDAVSIRTALMDLINFVRPKESQLNAGTVVDSKLTFINSGDQPVTVNVKEIFPTGGFIETAATKTEVAVDTRSYTLTVPALNKVSVDYLYRIPFEVARHKLVTEVTATWKTGIVDRATFESLYEVKRDLDMLLASINLAPPSQSVVPAAKFLDLATSQAKEGMLDAVLETIDKTSRGDREMQTNLDETVESLGFSKVTKGGAFESSGNDEGNNANEPTSSQGPTSSYVKGGCQLNPNAKPSKDWLGWILIPLSLLVLRRYRKCLALIVILLGQNVFAGDTGLQGFNRQLFQPVADQTGVYNIVGTEIPPALKPRVAFVTNFGSDSTTIVVPATNREFKILDFFWSGDFLVATGCCDHWSVGLALPVLFYGNGTNFNTLQSFNAAAFGDLRLDFKYRLIKENEKLPAIAFFSGFSFPTGSQAKFTGERGLTWEYRLVADKRIGDFQVFTNLGFKLRKGVFILSSEFGDAFTFGVGGRYQLPWQKRSWSVETELVGAKLFSDTRASSTPLELRLGARKKINERMTTYFGAGKGLTDAIGSPSFRLFGGLQWQF